MRRIFDFDNSDRKYDEYCDEIICSKDYAKCSSRSSDGDCLAEKIEGPQMFNRKCWHIWSCPRGMARNIGEKYDEVNYEV